MYSILNKSYNTCTKHNLKSIYFAKQLKKQFKLTEKHLSKLSIASFFDNKFKKGDILVTFLYIKNVNDVTHEIETHFAFAKTTEFKLFADKYLATNEVDTEIPIIIHINTANKLIWMSNKLQEKSQ